MLSAARRTSSARPGHFAQDPDGEPGAGERMPADHFLRQAQLPAHLADLVLEQFAQRLDQREGQPLGQSPHVVMGLDGDRGAAPGRDRLDHVGIEGALHQEPDVVAHLPRFGLEDVDERVPDAPALLLGIGDARRGRPGTPPTRRPPGGRSPGGGGRSAPPGSARAAAAVRDPRRCRSAGRRPPGGPARPPPKSRRRPTARRSPAGRPPLPGSARSRCR